MPLQLRLDTALSQHTLCGHSDGLVVDDSRFIDMRLNIELLTLQCAFSWLKVSWPSVYEQTVNVVAKELEVTSSPDLDWIELITGGWDYCLWCLWISIVLYLDVLSHARVTHITRWINHMSK
jgi:hypothetical protein